MALTDVQRYQCDWCGEACEVIDPADDARMPAGWVLGYSGRYVFCADQHRTDFYSLKEVCLKEAEGQFERKRYELNGHDAGVRFQ